MVHGKSKVAQMGILAERLKYKGGSKLVTNKVERKSIVICALEIGTSIMCNTFVIEYEEPYELFSRPKGVIERFMYVSVRIQG